MTGDNGATSENLPGSGHEHGHRHPNQPDLEDGPLGYYPAMADAVAELLIEKGVFGADDLRATIDYMASRTPALGARLVARAWRDPDFKRALVADSRAAAETLDIDTGPTPLLVMENTAHVHNVIVCTLCSCYPVFLLGKSPDWYKSRNYRSRVVREPRAVLAEFGTHIAPEREVRVHDSTADMRYMVLPMRPGGTDGWSEEALAALITRDALVGVCEVTR
ncbi:nitrile hydratase subunit alpha [Marivibrio halodurans]|uniref:Nitrile hydratase subunit alpha n=1 Tax=Marivibrio halodurans TaxID=2039722 RepID=A0A8J7V1Q3_9PROT|nr:nitrile hydratase subunit alpha [Marivibrio halodurans]MBP5858031.1 nitrile hydratase subunit alpha [Marivibrio halodurans]